MRIKLRFLEPKSRINLSLVEKNLSINFKFKDIWVITKPDYTGSYDVIPSFNIQKLLTKDKAMRDDVTIESIPFSEVTNPQNGITVTIGA